MPATRILLGVMLIAVSSLYAEEAAPAKNICQPDKCCQPKEEMSPLDKTLDSMQKKTDSIKTFQADVTYLFIQDPDLLDARRLQTGKLYYKKDDKKSNIRINFETLAIDEEDKEQHKEQIIFDGVWLTKIDYVNETVNSWQQAEENKPVNAFEFVSRNFPMVGFTKTEELRKHFDITLIENPKDDPNNQIHLNLKVKKDSKYKDQYKTMDFWVDKKSFIPVRMKTISLEDDVYDIRILKPLINKNFKNSVFLVENPKHFSQNREPLKKK